VEAAVAEIQHKLAGRSHTPTFDSVARFDGAFKDEPAFAEVVAYGRAMREADRPRDGDDS
jgi:hypothetical protein